MGVDLLTEIPKMAIFLLQNGGSTYTRQNTVCSERGFQGQAKINIIIVLYILTYRVLLKV